MTVVKVSYIIVWANTNSLVKMNPTDYPNKNIDVDKVYTSISTRDSAEQDAELLMGIGPRARILSEENLSSEKISIIKNEIIQLCEQRHRCLRTD